jgi:hypothetical protein
MSWKKTSGAAFAVLAAGWLLGAASAFAQDAVLYEVTEVVGYSSSGLSFKNSNASLMGTVKAGTLICPQFLADMLGVTRCSLQISATGHANDATGIGPMTGTMWVTVQNANTVDSPEGKVIQATLTGTIDLSQAINGAPLGAISGKFVAVGLPKTPAQGYMQSGSFTGVFRLPFGVNGQPYYLYDDGPHPAAPEEHSLGWATVKLEVNVSNK